MSHIKSIELIAREPANVRRKAFPLTVGVPFAKGVLGVNQPLALLNRADETVPLQNRVMETHEDGSVRWMLLDYQADFEPLKDSTYALRLGKKGVEVSDCRIKIEERGDLLIVENGVLKLEIDKTRCRPLLRVWYEGQLISNGDLSFCIKSDKEKEFFAANDSEVNFEIEESGPLCRGRGGHILFRASRLSLRSHRQ